MAHRKIEITDAHAALARHPSSDLGRAEGEDQAGKGGKGRLGSRFCSRVKRLLQNLKGV